MVNGTCYVSIVSIQDEDSNDNKQDNNNNKNDKNNNEDNNEDNNDHNNNNNKDKNKENNNNYCKQVFHPQETRCLSTGSPILTSPSP